MDSNREHVLAIVTSMDEYQARVLRTAQDRLAEHGLPLLVHCDGPLARGAAAEMLVELLDNRPPSAVLNVNSLDAQEQEALSRLLDNVGVPSVHVGFRSPHRASIWGDNAGGMRPLLAHLLDEHGARRVALVRGIAHHPDSIAREQVFRAEMAARDLPVDEDLIVTGEFLPEPAYAAVSELLTRRRDMDAIVALNDMSAISTIAALTEVGLRVPEDVAVTGFDNDLAARQWPGLTTVDQNFDEQGRVAAEMLIEQLDGTHVSRHVMVPSQLVVRGSVADGPGSPAADHACAIEVARLDKGQLANQDASLALSSALTRCWTVPQVVDAVATHLGRLGMRRWFLSLYDRHAADRGASPHGSMVDTSTAHLALAYTCGERLDLPADHFASHQLLPSSAMHELEDGMLVAQQLAVLGRPLGFVLYEQTDGSARLTAMMHTEVSRAIDAVITTHELEGHAHKLERVVDHRTRELQAEVATRLHAERELRRANAELRRLAMVDGLTRIANRAAFEQHLETTWAAQRAEQLSVLMIDVDAFKAFNDHYGHVMGDEALRIAASCIEDSVHDPQDLASRYGGEEFAVVLPDSGVAGAAAVAQRIRDHLADANIPHATSPVSDRLTVSIGIAVGCSERHTCPEELVNEADRALYRAKEQGRDRIVIATPEDSPVDSGTQPTARPANVALP